MASKPKHSEEHKERMEGRAAGRAYLYRTFNRPERVEELLGRIGRGFGIDDRRHRYLPHQGKREIARRASVAQ